MNLESAWLNDSQSRLAGRMTIARLLQWRVADKSTPSPASAGRLKLILPREVPCGYTDKTYKAMFQHAPLRCASACGSKGKTLLFVLPACELAGYPQSSRETGLVFCPS